MTQNHLKEQPYSILGKMPNYFNTQCTEYIVLFSAKFSYISNDIELVMSSEYLNTFFKGRHFSNLLKNTVAWNH